MRASLRLTAVMTILLALVASACGGGAESETAAAEPAAAADSSDDAPVAAAAPVLPTVAGGQLDFADLEGQDAILWFWAPW